MYVYKLICNFSYIAIHGNVHNELKLLSCCLRQCEATSAKKNFQQQCHQQEHYNSARALTCLSVWMRICYPEGCAAPDGVRCQCNTRGLLSKLEKIPPQRKIHVTSKSPVGDISDVTLIRTDTTLDHSQKAEKVCCKNGNAA